MNKQLQVPILEHNIVDWKGAAEVQIEHFLWADNGYQPKTICRIVATDGHLHLKFEVHERAPRAEITGVSDKVWTDSCVEFFFQPMPHVSKQYFNFEWNAIGALCLGKGSNRYDHTYIYIGDYKRVFHVETSQQVDSWSVSFRIPYTFIQEHFPDFVLSDRYEMRGNFYKCGELSDYPHYGVWSKIQFDHPEFHLTEYFGSLVFSCEEAGRSSTT